MGFYHDIFSIPGEIEERVEQCEADLLAENREFEEIRTYNQLKVLEAMQFCGLSQADFAPASGYGYGDTGREKTEAIFQRVFRGEDAIVRPSIASGTHAISTVLFSLLKAGDVLLSATGDPYDTLLEVIGIRGDAKGTLLEKGVRYASAPLDGDRINLKDLPSVLKSRNPALVALQRSTGYTNRRAFTISELAEAIQCIRQTLPDTIIFVDNCYGEFTERQEPLEIGADVIAGSLIKNPGGGIALSGGYIVGKKEYIERCINHLTAPGLGKETGLTFGTTRTTLQGLFLAPHITMEAMRGARLFGKVFSSAGYDVIPHPEDPRSDIIQAIALGAKEKVIAFCQAVQSAASVGSTVIPYPWDMPGYQDQVIMASGGFIDGSSIEVSADGPLREPFMVYYQGGLVYEQAKLACMRALAAVENQSTSA